MSATLKFQIAKHSVTRNIEPGTRLGTLVAVVTDDKGKRWDWVNLIAKRTGHYQGPFSMLGPTHESTTYDVEGWGTVSHSLQFDTAVQEYILEQFANHREEFITHQTT
jgi:hypothetical protein